MMPGRLLGSGLLLSTITAGMVATPHAPNNAGPTTTPGIGLPPVVSVRTVPIFRFKPTFLGTLWNITIELGRFDIVARMLLNFRLLRDNEVKIST